MRCTECQAFLAAGARFCSQCGTRAAPGADAGGAPERRQLTVLFCDLVGSTSLSSRLDPEALRDVIGAYHRRIARAVAPFDGFVAQYLGDGALVYFGYPRSHENNAERAVRAALSIVSAVAGISDGRQALGARAGIATGLVVVGDVVSAGSARELTAMGETPNLAARLQALAEPGAVVIADHTRRLAGGLFQYRDLGTVSLKGFDSPVRAWQVLDEERVESRFAALHSELGPLIGREDELRLLEERWRQAERGQGQVVILSAEPGIGKSRLAAAFRERLAERARMSLQYYCSPHHSGSALAPFIAQLEREAAFAKDESSSARLKKLEALLGVASPEPLRYLPVIAELLSIPTPGAQARSAMAPHERKRQIFAALTERLSQLARLGPALVVFEDLHWIDPTSRELLGLLVARCAGMPILALLTCRPEFENPWPGLAHVSVQTLPRLNRSAGGAMLERLSAGRVPRDIAERILDRADGVPLFVEELTKSMLESGAGRGGELAIPASLQDSLLARLDRLGAARDIAHVAAAMGREFSGELLAAVAGMDEAAVAGALDPLLRAGLIFARGDERHPSYYFKHVLVQDAAYGSLLMSRRRELHARIGEVLETRFPNIAAGQPEVIARHFTEAGLMERAVHYWLRAGQLASERSAYAEAIAHLQGGLTRLADLREGILRDRLELELQCALGPAFIATKGYAAAEAEHAYLRARELIRVAGQPARLETVLNGLYVVFYNQAAFDRVLEVTEEFVAFAESANDSAVRCLAHRTMTGGCLSRGDFPRALEHGRKALANYDPQAHSPPGWRFPHDLGVGSMCQAALALWHAGLAGQAAAMAADAVALTERLKHANTEGYCRFYAGVLFNFYRLDFGILERESSDLVGFGLRNEAPQWVAWGTCFEAPALTASGRAQQALLRVADGLALCDRLGNRAFRPTFLGFQADAKAALGQTDEALRAVEEALRIAERTHERGLAAELWRCKGNIALGSGALDDACRAFEQAAQLARRQGSLMLELRAATSLAGGLSQNGKLAEARARLEPVYRQFTGGSETADLNAARALLSSF